MRSRDEIFGHILCSKHCKARWQCTMFAKLLLQDSKALSQGTNKRAWGIVNWVAQIVSISTDIQIQILGSDWVWKCRSVHLYWFLQLTKELNIALNNVWASLLLWQRVQTFLCHCFDVVGVLISWYRVLFQMTAVSWFTVSPVGTALLSLSPFSDCLCGQ